MSKGKTSEEPFLSISISKQTALLFSWCFFSAMGFLPGQTLIRPADSIYFWHHNRSGWREISQWFRNFVGSTGIVTLTRRGCDFRFGVVICNTKRKEVNQRDKKQKKRLRLFILFFFFVFEMSRDVEEDFAKTFAQNNLIPIGEHLFLKSLFISLSRSFKTNWYSMGASPTLFMTISVTAHSTYQTRVFSSTKLDFLVFFSIPWGFFSCTLENIIRVWKKDYFVTHWLCVCIPLRQLNSIVHMVPTAHRMDTPPRMQILASAPRIHFQFLMLQKACCIKRVCSLAH